MHMTKSRVGMLIAVLVLLGSASCKSVFAPDEGDLRGTVLDDCGEPVEGAQVTAGGRSTRTASSGAFRLTGLSTGGHTVTAEKTAYENASVRGTLPETGGLSCDTPSGSAPTLRMTLEGWTWYGSGDYGEAAAAFRVRLADNEACRDAWTGLGWALARLDSLASAAEAFDAALSLDDENWDAHAGRALVSSARGVHDAVLTSAAAVLDAEGDAYVFGRDEAVTALDLRMVLAQSAFHVEAYDVCQAQVDALDPDNGLDPGEPSTWIVSGTTYGTYEEALLVAVHALAPPTG